MKEEHRQAVSLQLKELMKDRLYVYPKNYDYASDIPQTTHRISSDAEIEQAELSGQKPLLIISLPNAKLIELSLQRMNLIFKIEKMVEEAGWEFEGPYHFKIWPKSYKMMLVRVVEEEKE